MLNTTIAVSDDIDPSEALQKVLLECTEKIGSTPPQVGIFFTSCMDVDLQGMLGKIVEAFPSIDLIGCTTDGEISSNTSFIEDSVALLLLSSDTIEFSTAIAENVSDNANNSFIKAAEQATAKLHSDPVCALTFPDGLTTVGTSLDRMICEAFGDDFPVFGGTAGDHYLLTATYQFFGDKVYRDSAPLLLIGGDAHIASSVQVGPVPTGLHYTIGRFENNIVFEIDGKSALDFYLEHLGDHQEQVTQFPLAVYENEGEDFYLRDPLMHNKEDGSISFVGNFPASCTVRLTIVSRNDVLTSAERANRSLQLIEGKPPELLFLFPCTSQRHVLGSKTNEKFRFLQESMADVPFFGFYCYGEIAPLSPGQPTRFHK